MWSSIKLTEPDFPWPFFPFFTVPSIVSDLGYKRNQWFFFRNCRSLGRGGREPKNLEFPFPFFSRVNERKPWASLIKGETPVRICPSGIQGTSGYSWTYKSGSMAHKEKEPPPKDWSKGSVISKWNLALPSIKSFWGALGWLSQLSIWLWISAQVMISLFVRWSSALSTTGPAWGSLSKINKNKHFLKD